MASITTSLNHNQVEDLVGDISAAQLVSASTTDLTYALTYSGDDQPHASTLHVSGSFTLSGSNVTGGTVSSFDFLSGTGASLLLVGGVSLDFSQASGLLSNPDTFGDFVEHLGEANDDDLEIGDDGDDDMHGGQGDDDMLGGGGDDHMHGGQGNDHVSGGDGDDDLSGGLGDDHLDGGHGSHDSVSFDSAKKIVVDLSAGTAKGEGNDTLVGIEDVAGTHGSDVIVGDANANELLGDGGNDKLTGLDGDDHLVGDDGNDKLDGGDGNDILEAGRGNDHLDGGNGSDILDGGDGNDKLSGGAGDDDIDGGNGNDNISTGDGLNIVLAGAGNDKVLGGNDADNISGGDGNDTIMTAGGDDLIDGGAGKDNIKAGDGNDRIDGGDGDDKMAGGAGDDTYFVSSAKDKIMEMAGEGNDTVVSSASFSLAKLANVENIELTGIANVDATGNTADNILTGNDGNNALDGGAGNDVLIGGAGADTLTGGAGNDTFIFDNLAVGGVDTVKDFTHGSDVLALDADVFTALAGSVDLNANVAIGTAAADANDFLVFDSTTGALYYDQDGNGAGAAVQIATLTGVTTVNGSDFTIV
ncbi:calcium-binding protein [Azoarcus sp. KH32C]|uniref:calcium-binding protein n=1 Tax=Azoarcus sp. KH32C TaxID=748247 RepID=UPI00023862E6|nr:calcium-binding protein [Azoarcus sp. KH32C]BAL25720.1 hypothetical protein AZKH_3431 [Azoarcus sp. KH32C]